GNLALAGGAVTVSQGGNSDYSGTISGTGTSLTKTGSGTLTLTGTNTYSGATTIAAGTLSLKSTTTASGGSATSGFNIASGATLNFDVVDGAHKDYLPNGGSVQFTGNGTLSKTGGGDLFWGQGGATFALGAGSQIDVQGGMLIGGSHGNEAWTNNLASLNIAAGATFSGVEAAVSVDALTGPGRFTSGYPGDPAGITTGVNNYAAGTYNVAGLSIFSGTISDLHSSAKLTKVGTGTLILSGANTYSGTTSINGGSVAAGPDQASINGAVSTAFGTSAITVNDGGSLNLAGRSIANAVTLTGQGQALVSGPTTTFTGALQNGRPLNPGDFDGGYMGAAITGVVTLSDTGSAGGPLINNGAHINISGKVSGAGGLIKDGSGFLFLTNSVNDYSGGTTLLGGTLAISTDSNLGAAPSTATATSLVLNGGALQASLGLTGTTNTIALDTNRGISIGTGGGTITTDSGVTLTSSAAVTATGNLTKDGAGTLLLSGDYSFSPVSGSPSFSTTTISAGSLVLRNDAPSIGGSINGFFRFTGAGGLTIEPVSASFSGSNTSGPLRLSDLVPAIDGLGSFTLGKAGNTRDIHVDAKITAASQAYYGGDV
ncbi:hypothetical protein EBZ70_12490, partial [bacterium]|nr:hypothetical protein [bacterium]